MTKKDSKLIGEWFLDKLKKEYTEVEYNSIVDHILRGRTLPKKGTGIDFKIKVITAVSHRV